MATLAGYIDYVYVNCPFDDGYMPCFSYYLYGLSLGIWPPCTLSEDDAIDNHLDKIIIINKGCLDGIQDISRVKGNTGGQKV